MPEPPPGHKWKAVINNQYVSWLAGWKDSINTKDWKCVSLFCVSRCLCVTTLFRFLRYVQLGATSTIKGESDQRKYEKARARGLTLACLETEASQSEGARAQEAHRQHPRGLQEDDEVQGQCRGKHGFESAAAPCPQLTSMLLSNRPSLP